MNSQSIGIATASDAVEHQIHINQHGFNQQCFKAPPLEHWVAQLHGVPAECINQAEHLLCLLQGMAKALRLTAVSSHAHHFGPGASAVLILAESHLSAHSWPENGYLHLDLVTCAARFSCKTAHSTQICGKSFLKAAQQYFQTPQIQLTQLKY